MIIDVLYDKATHTYNYVMNESVVHRSNQALNWEFTNTILNISIKDIIRSRQSTSANDQPLCRPTLDEDDLNLSLKAHQRRKTAVWHLYAKNVDKR